MTIGNRTAIVTTNNIIAISTINYRIAIITISNIIVIVVSAHGEAVSQRCALQAKIDI